MKNYVIHDLPDYFKQYKKSIKNPKKFWDKIADENFVWYQRWNKVVKFDMEEAKIEYGNAMGKLVEGKGNLIGSVERLKKMGAKAKKALPESILKRAGEEE